MVSSALVPCDGPVSYPRRPARPCGVRVGARRRRRSRPAPADHRADHTAGRLRRRQWARQVRSG